MSIGQGITALKYAHTMFPCEICGNRKPEKNEQDPTNYQQTGTYFK